MPICTSCGRASGAGFRFCPHCAAPFDSASVPREQRKTVTALFCDLTGSTALGESVDPEALRDVLASYFERLRAILEAHGGTVEKFIGDAVMAVFGVPIAHEDDALRAVRAAADIREALPLLGVVGRVGVNTGEVVTGTAELLAMGDAINVAKRLEEAAQPGEVLLGAETVRLVRAAVEVEPLEALRVKGKSAAVVAYRLLAVRAAVEARSVTPLVGRQTELRRLQDAFAQAVRDRSCQLFTVLGTAGVGKSRLTVEFGAAVDAHVVRGRCLAYGEGITYWPVVEAVRQLDALPTDEAAAAPLRSLLGESDAATSPEEIAWAFRMLLEQTAREQPLVCVLEDLHWGEQTFLDLVEHVADLSRNAPMLLLCTARPELLERRPGWGGGKWNATSILLEPLDGAETDQLLDALGGVDHELRARIRAVAEGNPLFLEEMLALVRESHDEDVAVPPTIQALLAARLDQLDPAERSVLELGAVEGRTFHRGVVEALGDGRSFSSELLALVRNQLIRPEPTQFPDEDAFRFRHVLIRDAAYDTLPKAARAELHERLADWLEQRGDNPVELDELLGYHLERAARYRAELGRSDPALSERAGGRLASASQRARSRGDIGAARALLERALELRRPSRLDIALELDLALAQPNRHRSAAIADSAAVRASAAGDDAGEATARLAAAQHRLSSGEGGVAEVERLAGTTLPLLEQAGDHALLAHVWNARAIAANFRGRCEEWTNAAEKAFDHAQRAGWRYDRPMGHLPALVYGPRPADEVLRAIDAGPVRQTSPPALLARALVLAMLGDFDQSATLTSDAEARRHELAAGEGVIDELLAEIATVSGDHERAARQWRDFCDLLKANNQNAIRSTAVARLGRSLCALGRHDEAEPLARISRELGADDDIATQTLWRQAQALVDAHRGKHIEAEVLARDAVALSEQTDMLNMQGDALCDLAEVLAAAGRPDEAAAMLEQALDRYERKQNLAMVQQVRARLTRLRALPLGA